MNQEKINDLKEPSFFQSDLNKTSESDAESSKIGLVDTSRLIEEKQVLQINNQVWDDERLFPDKELRAFYRIADEMKSSFQEEEFKLNIQTKMLQEHNDIIKQSCKDINNLNIEAEKQKSAVISLEDNYRIIKDEMDHIKKDFQKNTIELDPLIYALYALSTQLKISQQENMALKTSQQEWASRYELLILENSRIHPTRLYRNSRELEKVKLELDQANEENATIKKNFEELQAQLKCIKYKRTNYFIKVYEAMCHIINIIKKKCEALLCIKIQ